MQKILIIEDDEKLREELETFLNRNGFIATSLKKFDNAVEDILKAKADLLLIDINLPYTDGEFICKEIRKTSNVPIIMVTSRDNEIDELLSLNYGADQYVTKPYNIQILLAKIVGLLKRNQNSGNNPDKIDCGNFILNTAGRIIENEDKKIELNEKALKAGEEFLAANAKKDGIKTTESGLQYKIEKEGTGAIPADTSVVRVHYKGTLIDGTEFDSSYKRGEPTEFPVNRVIKGWTEALQLMPVGSKWTLYIPSNLAYGPQGARGAIGPNETLIFEVELIDIVDPNAQK